MHVTARRAPGQVHSGGFTLAEFLVASVIMSAVLLGLNAVFQQTMDVEGRTTVRWNDRAAAEAVSSHLAETVEHCVNLPTIPALVIKSEDESSGYLICQAGLQRRRYQWSTDYTKGGCAVELQVMILGGTRNLTFGGEQEETQNSAWGQVNAVRIGNGLKRILVRVKPLEDLSAEWKDRWEGNVGRIAVQIQVEAGDQTVERIVVPRASAEVLEQIRR